MTNNQLHGKKFEDLIKGCGLFPGASDQSRSSTVGIDIEAKFDRSHGLPTSIKTTGSGIVTLSDARRFWAIDYPFRMLVGTYRQVSERKLFSIVHEFLILPTDLEILRGRGITRWDQSCRISFRAASSCEDLGSARKNRALRSGNPGNAHTKN
jgi:hypothetical protein